MGPVFVIYSQEWNCLFPNHLLPHTAYSSAERIQHTPNWVGLEELKHSWALAGAGTSRCHWSRILAAGCLPGAAGRKVKEWTKATAQLPQWPSAMLICNRNAPSSHAHVSTCFLGYLQHHIHTHDTEQAHTAHVHTAHKPASSPPAAPHPCSTTPRCAHQGPLVTCMHGEHARPAAWLWQPHTRRSNGK